MSLLTTLSEVDTKQLKRAFKSNKAYLYFDISVFNVGASISIKCTDTFKQPSNRTWNGYDFIIENDDTTKYYIEKELNNRSIYKKVK